MTIHSQYRAGRALRLSGRRRRLFEARPATRPLINAAALAAIWLAVLGSAQSSHAQGWCGEGRTAGGQCTDAALAAAARQTAIVFSQPKISTTAYPVMPSMDARVRYPHALTTNPLQPSATGVLAPN